VWYLIFFVTPEPKTRFYVCTVLPPESEEKLKKHFEQRPSGAESSADAKDSTAATSLLKL